MRKLFFLVLLIGATVFVFKDKAQRQFFQPNDATPQNESQARIDTGKDVEVIAEGLDIPWEVVFLPNGEMLLTERPGNLVLIGKDKKKIKINEVDATDERGLMGLVLHPKFAENSYIYIYLSTISGKTLTNRVERYKFENGELRDRKVILQGIPGAKYHDGGRIAFGPDDYLYIATGDATNENLAQDKNSLAGKILRITDEGAIPSNNPFGNAVYSYGHRNIQGLTWDQNGQLYATEHGPSGLETGWDELNLIKKGANYGWPDRADRQKDDTEKAVIHSGSSTWAPAGAQHFQNKILFTGLRGEAVYVYDIENSNLSTVFKEQFGRLRTLKLAPDGYLYLLTNNTDGRGTPKQGDDKLLKINPKVFE